VALQGMEKDMNEYLLQQVLKENPELIEPGLTFVEHEDITFFRYPDSDWINVEEMVKKLAPCICDYVERMNFLLNHYRPKKNKT